MNNTFTIEIPALTQLLTVMETQNKELSEIKALLRIDRYDERDFVPANQFCMKNRISRKTMDKLVKEEKIEVDDSLGVKRYRKVLS